MGMPRSIAVPAIIAAALATPLLYVGLYLAVVIPGGAPMDFNPDQGYYTRIGIYRVGEDVCKTVFWPLEQVDRRVRPGVWDKGHVL
jgi:hypothetical protein